MWSPRKRSCLRAGAQHHVRRSGITSRGDGEGSSEVARPPIALWRAATSLWSSAISGRIGCKIHFCQEPPMIYEMMSLRTLMEKTPEGLLSTIGLLYLPRAPVFEL